MTNGWSHLSTNVDMGSVMHAIATGYDGSDSHWVCVCENHEKSCS